MINFRIAIQAGFLSLMVSSSSYAAERLAADHELIRRLGPNAYRDEPFDAPYIAVFESGGKRLIFVSADHSNGVNSAVAKTVRLAFKRFRPRAVIVEGLTGDSPKDHREWIEEAAKYAKSGQEDFPENKYPAYLAEQKKIPWDGGEPSLFESLQGLEQFGYTKEDLLGFLAARNVAFQNEKGPHTAQEFADELDEWLDRMAQRIEYKKGFRFSDFERWYDRRGSVGKSAHQIQNADVWSQDAAGPNFLQALHYHFADGRERAIVRRIESMLNQHNRVLVVYGSGHLVKQREVWRQALRPSKDLKPF